MLQDRHLIHPYPAMLHPQLVDYLINLFSEKDDIVFDPFSGSGVTLLQSARRNLFAYGCDINPLALLIAHAKTRIYEESDLIRDLHLFHESLKGSNECDVPQIKNIHYWYSDEVIEELGRARAAIKSVQLTYPAFFITIFGYIAREQSLTRNGEFKRYRVSDPSSYRYRCRVIERLIERTSEMVGVFANSKAPLILPKSIFHDCQEPIPFEQDIDLVISSPPYGDSGTTVAYGQYSSFALEWLQDLNPFANESVSVDRDGLGKKCEVSNTVASVEILAEVISYISVCNQKRASHVLWFFNGYFNVLQNVVDKLRFGGRVCLVVGNRTVCGVQIPMDQITAEFLSSLGLNVKGISSREIHNKVMPHANSPSNQKGKSGPTMNREFIVIATKD